MKFQKPMSQPTARVPGLLGFSGVRKNPLLTLADLDLFRRLKFETALITEPFEPATYGDHVTHLGSLSKGLGFPTSACS